MRDDHFSRTEPVPQEGDDGVRDGASGSDGGHQLEGGRDAQPVDGEAADEAADATTDAEVGGAENALDGRGRRHRRLVLDEGEDRDQQEGRAERLQRFHNKKPLCKKIKAVDSAMHGIVEVEMAKWFASFAR